MKSRRLEYGMAVIWEGPADAASAALHRRRLSVDGVVAAPVVGSAPRPHDNLVYTERRLTKNIDPGSPVLHTPSHSSQASPNSPV
jgi:hypothetical protein